MKEQSETEDRKIASLFYVLAAAQILQIAGGGVLGLLVAPASLFISRTETEAFVWIVLGFAGFVFIAVGIILIPLSIFAAVGFRRKKKWRKIVGFGTSCLAVLAFPFGTIFGITAMRKIS